MISDTQEWGGQQFFLVKVFAHGLETETKRAAKKEMFTLKAELESQGHVLTHYIYEPESSTYALYKKNLNPVP